MTQPTGMKLEVLKFRQLKIIADAGGRMTMQAFCDEHIRRGWAFTTLTPEGLGCEPTDIIQIKDPQKTALMRSH